MIVFATTRRTFLILDDDFWCRTKDIFAWWKGWSAFRILKCIILALLKDQETWDAAKKEAKPKVCRKQNYTPGLNEDLDDKTTLNWVSLYFSMMILWSVITRFCYKKSYFSSQFRFRHHRVRFIMICAKGQQHTQSTPTSTYTKYLSE